ncbi:MAG: 50S ribosomal protein L6 [Candidatus Edwardsbacteria bacterium]|nr:50S ribosomal protein L6 [Candidatus Edwardsbacteria bacterium]
MSRIGKKPVAIPSGVKVELAGNTVKVSGPKGVIEERIHPNIKVAVEAGQVVFTRGSEDKFDRALHGLSRALVANAVTGVSEGFRRVLQIYGVGYKVQLTPDGLTMQLGFSHPVMVKKPAGIEFEIFEDPALKATKSSGYQANVIVKGISKQLVGEVAAEIRGLKPPEPYAGKGIRYQDEQVRRKAGKTAAGATA